MIGIFWIAMSVSDFEGVHLTPRGDAAWSPRLMDQGGETISHLAWRWGSFKQGMQGRANWCWLRSAMQEKINIDGQLISLWLVTNNPSAHWFLMNHITR
jgi:hypothetical protein